MNRVAYLLLLAAGGLLHADVKLPALISDNMVLQQQIPARIWGQATVGENVTVTIAGQSAKSRTESDGKWEVFLAPMRAGGCVTDLLQACGIATGDAEQSTLTGFHVAGSDGRFKAEARLEGDTVVVSSGLVKDPIHVRYAWENDPVANLTNREGLPAVPFRTDSWN